MKKIKIAVVIGTRPDIIKMAPIIKELESSTLYDSFVVFTGQHKELGVSALNSFDIIPDFSFDLMIPGQSLGSLNSRCVMQLEKLFIELMPDLVLGHGDTTTCFSAALSAFYTKRKFIHIEAGLRSGDVLSPFPEEFNRQMIAKLGAYHFAVDEVSKANLISEGVLKQNISVTGNTIVDSVSYFLGESDIGSCKEELITLTLHRRENNDTQLMQTLSEIKNFAIDHPHIVIKYPVHPSPHISKLARNIFSDVENIELLSPLPYPEFLRLLMRSKLVITDSGGVQEEASLLGTKTLVLRGETERADGIEVGNTVLYKESTHSLYDLIEKQFEKSSQANFILNSGVSKVIVNKLQDIA